MKIFKIDVSKKRNDFNKFLEKISKFGRICIYLNTILLATKYKSLNLNDNEVEVSEITDINSQICSDGALKWARDEILKNALAEEKEKIQDKIKIMYDVLVEANKIISQKEK